MKTKDSYEVVLYAVRHGERDGEHDRLSEKGRRQVIATGRALKERHWSAEGSVREDSTFFFASDLDRATETAMLLASTMTTGMPPQPNVIKDPHFGFNHAYHEPTHGKPRKGLTTVAEVLASWTPASRIRECLQSAILTRATNACRQTMGKAFLFVGTHGPTGELACIDPATTGLLDVADICKYVVEVTDDFAHAEIVSSEIIKAPAVE